MKKTITTLLFLSLFAVTAQEMKDNLFATLHSSTLHLFHDSEMRKMDVTSYRTSDRHGFVVETEATYRKGRINLEKIRFSIKYTEYYILEDRKKSIGIYHIGTDRLFDKYERTDFNHRNMRTWTLQHHYDYKHDVLSEEVIRSIEYLSEGSAEVDTAHYLDTISYEIVKDGNTIKQRQENDDKVYTSYVLENDRLVKRANHFKGFDETYKYSYDEKGRLIKIENNLRDEEGKDIYTYTKLKYNSDGLVSEVLFYDESDKMLEKKVYEYK